MKVLLDTNILVRLAQPATPAAATAVEALDHIGKIGGRFTIVPQVLYEYWVVCTRPVDQNGLDHRVTHVSRDIERMKKIFAFLRDERSIFEQWHTLVHEKEARGKPAHDARLVAAMMRHGVEYILTFNDKDFQRYDAINVLHPETVKSVLS